MILRNATRFPIKMIKPDSLSNIITLVTNCELDTREALVFVESMRIISIQIMKDNIDLSKFHVFNIFFTLTGEITIYEESETNRGSQFHVAVYRMKQIRELHSEYAMMFIFLEEMVHYFWQSSDEAFVKNKVVEIMKIIIPNFSLNYMTERWSLNGI